MYNNEYKDRIHLLLIRAAVFDDVPYCKAIADANRESLGFIVAAIFRDAIQRNHLLVADCDGEILGFIRYNHRKHDDVTTVYDICVKNSARLLGVGKLLIHNLVKSCKFNNKKTIILRCPKNLPSNTFYTSIGFKQLSIEQGRKRELVLYELNLEYL
jgi:ribosomal protein S18 acetylase RimI-like enzyme